MQVFCNWIPLSVIDYDILWSRVSLHALRARNKWFSPGNYQILARRWSRRQSCAKASERRDECASRARLTINRHQAGLSVGPVRQGIKTRFDDIRGADYPSNSADTNVKNNITYEHIATARPTSTDAYGRAGRRIVIIPILKKQSSIRAENTVKFNRFGQFFSTLEVSVTATAANIEAE